MKIKAVIAGNHRQFEKWDWSHRQLKGYERCFFVNDINKLRGMRDIEIVLVGEYWLSPVFNDPLFQVLTHDLVVIRPDKGEVK